MKKCHIPGALDGREDIDAEELKIGLEELDTGRKF